MHSEDPDPLIIHPRRGDVDTLQYSEHEVLFKLATDSYDYLFMLG